MYGMCHNGASNTMNRNDRRQKVRGIAGRISAEPRLEYDEGLLTKGGKFHTSTTQLPYYQSAIPSTHLLRQVHNPPCHPPSTSCSLSTAQTALNTPLAVRLRPPTTIAGPLLRFLSVLPGLNVSINIPNMLLCSCVRRLLDH